MFNLPAIAIPLMISASFLAGCSRVSNAPSEDLPVVGYPVAMSKVKLTNQIGDEMPASILTNDSVPFLNVTLDGQTRMCEKPAFKQQPLRNTLGRYVKSRLDGTFLSLPWGNSQAWVKGYAALELPGDGASIFICGGDESPDRVRFAADQTWLCNLPSGRITKGPEMHWPRRSPSLTRLADGKILICGGSGGFVSNSESLVNASPLVKLPLAVEIYDPATNTISDGGALQRPRDQATVVALQDGKVLIIGGESPSDQSTQNTSHPIIPTVERYDPARKQSKMLGTLAELTSITWTARIGQSQLLLLGSQMGLDIQSADFRQPAVELVSSEEPKRR